MLLVRRSQPGINKPGRAYVHPSEVRSSERGKMPKSVSRLICYMYRAYVLPTWHWLDTEPQARPSLDYMYVTSPAFVHSSTVQAENEGA